MVYYCFVEAYDLTDKNNVIISIKDNGLDIRPKYLKKITLSEKSKRTYETGRQQSTFLYNPSYKERAVNASNAIQAKTVSCYDLNGQRVETFKSILKASEKTGIWYANIRYALRHPYHLMGGLYWRRGNNLVIELVEKPGKDYRDSRGSRITKFDLEGNPLERYLAISEAAKLNNISHRSIMQNVNNESLNAGGFIWRLGHHYKKLKL